MTILLLYCVDEVWNHFVFTSDNHRKLSCGWQPGRFQPQNWINKLFFWHRAPLHWKWKYVFPFSRGCRAAGAKEVKKTGTISAAGWRMIQSWKSSKVKNIFTRICTKSVLQYEYLWTVDFGTEVHKWTINSQHRVCKWSLDRVNNMSLWFIAGSPNRSRYSIVRDWFMASLTSYALFAPTRHWTSPRCLEHGDLERRRERLQCKVRGWRILSWKSPLPPVLTCCRSKLLGRESLKKKLSRMQVLMLCFDYKPWL